MNQILYIQKEKDKNTIEINKIILFFTIAMIVFGVVLIGEGVYGAYENGQIQEAIENYKPVASLDKEGRQVKIHASHIRNIALIEYNWNNDDDTAMEIVGNGRSVIIQRIDLPIGQNVLNVTVTDENGKTATYTKTFTSDVGKDIGKPNVTLSVNGNYIQIDVSDNVKMSYITYRWDNETETKVDALTTDEKNISTRVEIPVGRHELTVIAVDSSNNMYTKSQAFEGKMKPTIETYQEENIVYFIVKHDEGVAKIEHSINGQVYDLQFEQDVKIVYTQELAEGENEVIVKVTSAQNTTAEYVGTFTY